MSISIYLLYLLICCLVVSEAEMKIKQLKVIHCCHKNSFLVTLEEDLDHCQEKLIILQSIYLSLSPVSQHSRLYSTQLSNWNIVSELLLFHTMMPLISSQTLCFDEVGASCNKQICCLYSLLLMCATLVWARKTIKVLIHPVRTVYTVYAVYPPLIASVPH